MSSSKLTLKSFVVDIGRLAGITCSPIETAKKESKASSRRESLISKRRWRKMDRLSPLGGERSILAAGRRKRARSCSSNGTCWKVVAETNRLGFLCSSPTHFSHFSGLLDRYTKLLDRCRSKVDVPADLERRHRKATPIASSAANIGPAYHRVNLAVGAALMVS